MCARKTSKNLIRFPSFTVIAVGDVDQSRSQAFVIAAKALVFLVVGSVVQRAVFEYVLVHRQTVVYGQVADPNLQFSEEQFFPRKISRCLNDK